MIRKKRGHGIYHYKKDNCDKKKDNKINKNCGNVNYTQTVKENEAMYTKRDIKRARDVSELQQYLFWPKTSTVTGYINKNQINNCHLTEEDIHA